MKPSDIKVGSTYCNRGKGRTRRTVLEISDEILPTWYEGLARTDQRVVRYEQGGKEVRAYLTDFAKWCGREVEAAKNSG